MKQMTLVGNAHIDPVWLWHWQEGYHEVKATFRSALDRLEETDAFVFTSACACYYQWVEENDPEMFREIRQRVAEGRWCFLGGMWIQPDMNTPSGESITRQLLISQRYFQEKFGRTAITGYNVDSFGHNAMLPQFFRNAGIRHYVWMRPSIDENPAIPEGAMEWYAPDGSHVTAFRIPNGYCISSNLPEQMDEHLALSDRLHVPVMFFYGVGNHGGGPTKANLRAIASYRSSSPNGDKTEFGSPDTYFEQLTASGIPLPQWHTELQHHASGCYSTHSLSKRLHRQTENALLRMESFTLLSGSLTGHTPRKAFVEQAWRNLLFNEFHDIMGGCSIREALDDVCMQLHESMSIAAREENAALQKISWKIDTIQGHPERIRSKEENFALWGIDGQGTPIVVFNPHAFEAEGNVCVHQPIRTVRDNHGNPVPAQRVRASRTNSYDCWDSIFRAKVPAMGYRLYWVFFTENSDTFDTGLSVSSCHLENRCIRAELDPATGALTHLYRKDTGTDALRGPSSAKVIDISHCDTWAHAIFRFDKVIGEFGDARISVEEEGPVRAVVKVVTRYETSTLTLRYTLYPDSDQLDIRALLDLHTRHTMIKLCFPTNGTEQYSEIPAGILRRDEYENEQHCQRWFASLSENGGLAILNDGKYSYSMTRDGELRQTVANTSIFADHYGQEYRDDTCRFMDQGEQEFNLSLVPLNGDLSSAKLNRRAALLNRPLVSIQETYHAGPLPTEYSAISIDNPNVELAAIKRSEDDSGIVLRLSETTGLPQELTIRLTASERNEAVSLRGYEYATYFIPDDGQQSARKIPATELEE